MHSIIIDPTPGGGDVMSIEDDDGVMQHLIRGRLDANYATRFEIYATGKFDPDAGTFEVVRSSPRGPYDLVPFGTFTGIGAAITALRFAN
jgi:hypothetical protein